MSAFPLLDEALKLSPSERILLAEQIWDSLAREQSAPPLTDAQAAEVDRRVARLARTGLQGSPWAEVKARLKGRRGNG